MLNTILNGTITLPSFLICLLTAAILGFLTSLLFSIKAKISSSLAFTLVILPLAMAMVIMMVNGNLGLAVSVAGGFTLVRFRSIAGNGKDISAIFVVMALGVITGMGYIALAAIFFLVVAVVTILLTLIGYGTNNTEKLLKVTLPDNYDYDHLFDSIFKKYHVQHNIERIKTTNLGSLIEVSYKVTLPKKINTKAFIDDLRVKNANLEIQLCSYVSNERL